MRAAASAAACARRVAMLRARRPRAPSARTISSRLINDCAVRRTTRLRRQAACRRRRRWRLRDRLAQRRRRRRPSRARQGAARSVGYPAATAATSIRRHRPGAIRARRCASSIEQHIAPSLLDRALRADRRLPRSRLRPGGSTSPSRCSPADLGDWRRAGQSGPATSSTRRAAGARQSAAARASPPRRRSPGTRRSPRPRSAHSRDMAERDYFEPCRSRRADRSSQRATAHRLPLARRRREHRRRPGLERGRGRRRLAREPGALRQHHVAPTSPRWAPPIALASGTARWRSGGPRPSAAR